MATTSTKQVPGSQRQRTVVQLRPVRYQLSLYYLGHDRIAHHPQHYRCRYEFQRGQTTLVATPALLANRVRAAHTDAASSRAATPANRGGDASNPADDELFRLVILDNHGMRTADAGLLGRPAGDRTSKPASYQQRGWMPDVIPAVPFRAVVKKFIGDQQVDLTESLRLVVEIKDPVEEFDQTDGARRAFLEGFFRKYNRTDSNPDAGDDNALRAFAGAREPSAAKPGVRATTVLRRVAYVAPPVSDTGASTPNSVQWSQLTSAPAYGSMRAKFDVRPVTDGPLKVGVADFVFRPPPVGGDNYRLLLTLRDNSDKDVRDKKINGLDIAVHDDANEPIAKPRAYTTGRIVLWRKVKIRLLVAVNRVDPADIDWNYVQGVYRKAFIEVVPPEPTEIFNLTPQAWRNLLRRHFDPGNTDPRFDNDANFLPSGAGPDPYTQWLFPAFLHPPPGSGSGASPNTNDIRALARLIVNHACANVAPAITSPSTNTDQNNSEGFFIVYHQRPRPGISVVGASFGDRMFWFSKMASNADTSNTVAHELGHALYCRHAHTNYPGVDWHDGAAPPNVTTVQLADSRANNQALDHDQADAFNCLMAYTGPVDADFCAVCALTLRFYDRVEIQKENRYRRPILSGLSPARLVEFVPSATSASGNDELHETISNVPVNGDILVMAVGPEREFRDAGTAATDPALKGRVNITALDDNPAVLWSKSGAGDVSLTLEGPNPGDPATHVRVRGRRRGAVTLRYSKSGVTATANITVT